MSHTAPPRSCHIVGILLAGDQSYPSFAAFCETLRELGYEDGKNIRFEPRFAEGRLAELPALAADLLTCGVDIIAVIGAVTYFAAQKVAPDIPIAFSIVLDPVDAGIVSQRETCGGRTTGSTNFDPKQIDQQVRFLKQVVPGLKRLAVLGDAGVPDILAKLSRAAGKAHSIDTQLFLLKSEADLTSAFAEFEEAEADALLCLEVPRTTAYGAKIVVLANAAGLPSIFGRDHARFEPLMAYGTSLAAASARMATQVDAILRGAEPNDLPIQYVVRPELILNLNAARQLRVQFPGDLIASAHQTIG